MTRKETMNLDTAFQEFISDCKYKNLSPKTITYYKDTFHVFTKFCVKMKLKTLESITTSVLKSYCLDLQERVSAGAVLSYFRSIRSFFGFCTREEYITINPFKKFTMPQAPKLLLPYVKKEEFDVLLGLARMNDNCLRDSAILSILLDCGLRASEICSLKLSDFQKENGTLKVFGKGSKERIVPVSRVTIKRIQSYIQSERYKTKLNNLFLTHPEKGLCYRALREILRRLYKKSGLEQKTLHAFRRSLAVYWCKNSGDLVSLSRIFGHTTLSQSAKYAVLDGNDLKEIHSRVSMLGGRMG
jgi:integrase/recombinase XerD